MKVKKTSVTKEYEVLEITRDEMVEVMAKACSNVCNMIEDDDLEAVIPLLVAPIVAEAIHALFDSESHSEE